MDTIFRYVMIAGMLMASLNIYIGCDQASKAPPRKVYKYTIWVGSPAFGSITKTNAYTIVDDILYCTDGQGKDKALPLTNVYEISTN